MAYEVLEFLGWVSAVFVGLALANYFVKVLNKYISLPLYKKVMKLVIRYHRWFGGAAVIVVLSHFLLAYSQNWLKLGGSISAILLILISLFGLYGVIVHKGRRGTWLKIHRVLAFTIMGTLVVHIIIKL